MMSIDFGTCVYDIFHKHLRRDWPDVDIEYLLLY